ncbi:MAG: hypothetical protein ACYCZ0_03400 [Minisyncoccota bacterium]
MMHVSRREIFVNIRKQLYLAALLAVVALFAAGLDTQQSRAPFASAEVEFTDASAGGMQIVPASCPSDEHYVGECSPPACNPPYYGTYPNCVYVPPGTERPGGPDGSPPSVSGNACVIVLSPSTIALGGSSVMSWNSSYSVFGIPFSMSGTITPTPGTVSGSGATTVSPSVSTTYTGTFTSKEGIGTKASNWFTPVTCSARLTVLPADEVPGSCSVYNFCRGSDVYQRTASCTDQFVRSCAFGCANGVCLGAPAPTGFLRAKPSLVRSGDTTTVEWSATQVSSCTVTGTNGDSWSGKSGTQTSGDITSKTTYTLSCIGLDESILEMTAVVNVTPIFDEQ